MAIMKDKATAAPVVQHTPAKIESAQSLSVIIDNNQTPIDSLITHVAGSAVVVDYYRLVVNKDNALYSQDVGQTGVQQQYILYKAFELRQKGSLSVDQDDTDKVFTVRGTAVVHSGLIPNEGDMISADVGDGRVGIYNVTRSQRLAIMKDTVYQIEYSLVYFTNDKPESFLDLTKKVIETYHYVKERLDYNDTPFLTAEEYKFILRIGGYYKELSSYYFAWFFSKEFAAFIVPGQPSSTFDYFLYKAYRSIFRDGQSDAMQKHQAINIDDDDVIDRGFDLFTVLLERSADRFLLCDQKAGITRTVTFHRDGASSNIRYTGIRNLVYPLTKEVRADQNHNRMYHPVLDVPLVPTLRSLELGETTKEVTAILFGTKQVFLIKPVTIDTCYVFSQDFYDRTSNLSLLEEQTLAYIDNKALNPATIKLLCENCKYWPRLERFYYIPVLLILIQSILKDV